MISFCRQRIVNRLLQRHRPALGPGCFVELSAYGVYSAAFFEAVGIRQASTQGLALGFYGPKQLRGPFWLLKSAAKSQPIRFNRWEVRSFLVAICDCES